MTRLPRKTVLPVYLTVVLFAFGQCKRCFFPETNQTIDKCQLSDWFPWDCLCCGSDVLQQTLAMHNRGMCCPVGVDSNTCKRECNFHTATSEQGLCADHCSHLMRLSWCSISKDATTRNPTVYLIAKSETTNKIPLTLLNGMPTTGSNGGSAIGHITGSNGGSAIGHTTGSNGGSAIGLTTSSNGGSAIGLTTSSNGGSAIGLTTGSNGGSAIGHTTSSNGGSAIGLTTGSNGGSAIGLTTSSNAGSAIGPTTSSNGGSVIGSTTISNASSAVKSTSSNDESTLNDTASQNGESANGSSNSLNGGVSYAEDGNNYCYIVTLKVPVFTNMLG